MSVSPSTRASWLKTLHTWHWISSALCLVGMLLFAVTGFTLNHAAQIESQAAVALQEAQLPPALLRRLDQAEAARSQQARQARDAGLHPLPAEVAAWLRQTWQAPATTQAAEWSPEEVYLSLPHPGGDAWVRIDRASGLVEYERTDRGWIAYFNDLHKGRHSGLAWSWFIDIFAAGSLVFCVTGLFILTLHAAQRPLVWPVTALGLVIPLLLALLFIH